jgi:hypothetical protein
MNSSSVRVECPIVSTTGERSPLGILFSRALAALELILDTLILGLFRMTDEPSLEFTGRE